MASGFITSLDRRGKSDRFCGFPGGSVVGNLPANAGDVGSIPGSGMFTGEGIGYPHQYSWASLVAQLAMGLEVMVLAYFNVDI